MKTVEGICSACNKTSQVNRMGRIPLCPNCGKAGTIQRGAALKAEPAAAPAAAPPQRRRKAEPDDPLTPIERAQELLAAEAKVVQDLRAHRATLLAKVAQIDAAIAKLEHEDLTPPKPKLRPVAARPSEPCRHGVAADSCALCADSRKRIEEAAQARPHAG
jgi:predicted RNA-binding Zn-ribbon protein involved in translation (DUF1610 family)